MQSSIVINRPVGKRRRIREKHIDDTGRKHLVSYWATNDFDVEVNLIKNASKIQINIIDEEVSKYLKQLSKGINPFRDKDNIEISPIHITRNNMLVKVLTEIFTTNEPTKYMKAAFILDKLKNEDIRALTNVTDIKVSEIRSKVAKMKEISEYLTSYIPPLEGN